jgi:hypothetical protein
VSRRARAAKQKAEKGQGHGPPKVEAQRDRGPFSPRSLLGREWFRQSAVLIVFTITFLALTSYSFTGMSATYDESIHLTTGYAGVNAGDHRFDPEHPPFTRMWAALPLLFQDGIRFDTRDIDNLPPAQWVGVTEWWYAYLFVYKLNPGDRLLYPARFMITLLGVLLGIFLFFWARAWLGFWPAVIALSFYALEPNILAHSSLVTTDFGVTCFFFGAIYFLWRTSRSLSVWNIIGLSVLSALAVVSKYSGVLLGPVILILLLIHSLRDAPWRCTIGHAREISTRWGRLAASGLIVLLIAIVCWAGIWASYGFRFMPSDTPGWQFHFDSDPLMVARAPRMATVIRFADSHHLLPNAFSEGLLLMQARAQGRATYFLGKSEVRSYWYYFPVAFLIKTPISLILLFLAGLVLCVLRWKESFWNGVFLLVPVSAYMAFAMRSDLNIGLRHILPIYPFVILFAAMAAAWVLKFKPKRIAAITLSLLCAFWLFEMARVYPHDLAFFNTFIGGPRNGYKYLSDSNLDWGQDMKSLKQWINERHVQHINTALFGTADPAYYGIDCTFIPGSPFFASGHLSYPKLPGYVAVSYTILQGEGMRPEDMRFIAPLLTKQPAAIIGNSIRVYWIDSPWW